MWIRFSISRILDRKGDGIDEMMTFSRGPTEKFDTSVVTENIDTYINLDVTENDKLDEFCDLVVLKI